MNGTTLGSVKGTSTLTRPKFGPGMLLKADDLDAMTTYTRELNRLLFRSFFGCGVVCGLKVTAKLDRCGDLEVDVTAGLALSCCGDPIYVPKDQSVTIETDKKIPDHLWVLLCATSKCCAPRTSSCGCDDDSPSSTPTREKDCFEIRVVAKEPKCGCYCPPRKAAQPVVPEKGELVDEAFMNQDETCPCGPTDGCYTDHYEGNCACCDDCTDCTDGSSCDCSCVVLACLTEADEDKGWWAQHCCRRFIRPVLMRDPDCLRRRVKLEEEVDEVMLEEVEHAAARPRRAKGAKKKVNLKGPA